MISVSILSFIYDFCICIVIFYSVIITVGRPNFSHLRVVFSIFFVKFGIIFFKYALVGLIGVVSSYLYEIIVRKIFLVVFSRPKGGG